MTFEEKFWYLKENYPREFARTREEVFKQLSYEQPFICKCGHLATSLHERNCSKFNLAVDRKTCRLLKHLIKQAHDNGNTSKGGGE